MGQDTAGRNAPGRYVIGVDGSGPSDAALRWGVLRASALGARVVLAHVIEDEWGLIGHEWAEDSERAGTAVLERALALCRQLRQDVAAEWVVLRGSPAWELAAFPEPDDLLIIGTHKTGYLHGRVLGSRSVLVASLAACSVVVVPDTSLRYRHGVVAGVDWSMGSTPAIISAAREAERTGDDVLLIHAAPRPGAPARSMAGLPMGGDQLPGDRAGLSAEVAPSGDDGETYPVDAMRALLRDAMVVAREAAPGATVRTRVSRRCAAEALLDASRDACLLVVGVTRRADPGAAVIGSVTHDVLMNINAPVLVSRTMPD
jgi:nucleotide-binding universal stress UspA family protein